MPRTMVPEVEVKTSLLVVDDDPLVLEALGRYFASAEDMEVRACLLYTSPSPRDS